MKRNDGNLKKQMEESLSIKENNFGPVISTGSTLLDLAISGERIRGGGIPAGLMIEIYGPENIGKSVLLYQIMAHIQRQGGNASLNDTEQRSDFEFASLFGAELDEDNVIYETSIKNTFEYIREKFKIVDGKINGFFIDSLANLDEPDTQGGYSGARRASIFTEEIRRTAAWTKNTESIIVCSNQIRDNIGVTFGEKTRAAGASRQAKHQFSLIIKISNPQKRTVSKTINGVKISKVAGTSFSAKITKSSIDKPFREAQVHIEFDYGVDDIRGNLQYLKQMTGAKKYFTDEISVSKAIENIEKDNLEKQLKEKVINLWQEIENEFKQNRKKFF